MKHVCLPKTRLSKGSLDLDYVKRSEEQNMVSAPGSYSLGVSSNPTEVFIEQETLIS